MRLSQLTSGVTLAALATLISASTSAQNLGHTSEYQGAACQLGNNSKTDCALDYTVDGAQVTPLSNKCNDSKSSDQLLCPVIISGEGDFQVSNFLYSVLWTIPGANGDDPASSLSSLCNIVAISPNNGITVSNGSGRPGKVHHAFLQCFVPRSPAGALNKVVLRGYTMEMSYVDNN